MDVEERDPLGMEFLTAVYEVLGPETEARARAERIVLIKPSKRTAVSLRLRFAPRFSVVSNRFGRLPQGRYEATIRYAGDLVGKELSDLLNLLFGTSSLRSDVRLLSFSLTDGLLSSWRGPRYGLVGLRRAVGV
jgi:ribulose-bisphosphate carboxylase large chain